MPVFGFSTANASHEVSCKQSVLDALNLGYCLISTGETTGAEIAVGEAIKQWGGDREDLFIVTRLMDGDHG